MDIYFSRIFFCGPKENFDQIDMKEHISHDDGNVCFIFQFVFFSNLKIKFQILIRPGKIRPGKRHFVFSPPFVTLVSLKFLSDSFDVLIMHKI